MHDCAGATSRCSRDWDVLVTFIISAVANFKGSKESRSSTDCSPVAGISRVLTRVLIHWKFNTKRR